MKISKILSVAIITGSLFFVTDSMAQEKTTEKEVEKKELADKVEKKEMKEELKVEETMKADAAPKMVGGAKMFATKNIVENASKSADHTTLVAAVKAADLVKTLSSEGPFTVFAPTNEAFDALPEGTVENLLKPENLEQLQTILKYHVVSGKFTAKKLTKLIEESEEGKARLETVAGGTLTAWAKDGKIYISDENGTKAEVTIADVKQSNGVVHVTNAVVLPKS